MGVKIRIGIASISEKRMGSVELPEDITLYCPQCGTECMDKGQCSIDFAPIPQDGKTLLHLIVDCRSCGCIGKPPEYRGI